MSSWRNIGGKMRLECLAVFGAGLASGLLLSHLGGLSTSWEREVESNRSIKSLSSTSRRPLNSPEIKSFDCLPNELLLLILRCTRHHFGRPVEFTRRLGTLRLVSQRWSQLGLVIMLEEIELPSSRPRLVALEEWLQSDEALRRMILRINVAAGFVYPDAESLVNTSELPVADLATNEGGLEETKVTERTRWEILTNIVGSLPSLQRLTDVATGYSPSPSLSFHPSACASLERLHLSNGIAHVELAKLFPGLREMRALRQLKLTGPGVSIRESEGLLEGQPTLRLTHLEISDVQFDEETFEHIFRSSIEMVHLDIKKSSGDGLSSLISLFASSLIYLRLVLRGKGDLVVGDLPKLKILKVSLHGLDDDDLISMVPLVMTSTTLRRIRLKNPGFLASSQDGTKMAGSATSVRVLSLRGNAIWNGSTLPTILRTWTDTLRYLKLDIGSSLRRGQSDFCFPTLNALVSMSLNLSTCDDFHSLLEGLATCFSLRYLFIDQHRPFDRKDYLALPPHIHILSLRLLQTRGSLGEGHVKSKEHLADLLSGIPGEGDGTPFGEREIIDRQFLPHLKLLRMGIQLGSLERSLASVRSPKPWKMLIFDEDAMAWERLRKTCHDRGIRPLGLREAMDGTFWKKAQDMINEEADAYAREFT